MNPLIQLKTITLPLLITLTLLCFALLPKVQAVGPDTEGNIAGANNGEKVVSISKAGGFYLSRMPMGVCRLHVSHSPHPRYCSRG
jgi:hypothetical protein